MSSGDYSWLDTYKDGVHGVPVQELLAALSEGKLPDALHEKLFLQLKDGDQQWEGNVAALRNGAMMRENYSRQKNAFKQERDAFVAERQQFIEDLRGLQQDPEQFLYSMQAMGMPVLEAAKMLATQFATRDYMNRQVWGDQYDAMTQRGERGPGNDWYDAIQARRELDAMKRQQARLQQNQQQASQRKQFEQRSHAVQNAAIEALNAAGIDYIKHPQYWDRTATLLQRIYDAKPESRDGSEKPLTRSDVREAVKQVKAEIDAFYGARGEQTPTPVKPGSAALDTGAGKQVPARAPKQNVRKTTDEIAREMRERAGIRIR